MFLRRILTLAILTLLCTSSLCARRPFESKVMYLTENIGSGMAFGDDSYNVFSEFYEASGLDISICLGTNFNLLWGARARFQWMKMYNRQNIEAYEENYSRFSELVPNKGFYGYNICQLSVEGTFNVSNFLMRHRPTHNWNWYIYAGPGATVTYNYEKTVKLWWGENAEKYDLIPYRIDDRSHLLWNFNIGHIINYRLADNLDLSADIGCSFTGDNLEGVVYEEFYDAIITYSLGLKYYF